MWEQIRANKRNSILLLMLMAAVLGLLGWIIGMSVSPDPRAGYFGVGVALIIWLILAMVSFAGGDAIFLAASKAMPVTKDAHPQLFNVVEEMAIAAQLPVPKVYIINDPAPNAFATGRNPQTASLAVTAGILGRLNRDEHAGSIRCRGPDRWKNAGHNRRRIGRLCSHQRSAVSWIKTIRQGK